MPGVIDTSMPPWLAQQFGPKPPQSPWIVDAIKAGFDMGAQRQKLPLEIRQLAIQNQMQQIAFDTAHQQFDAYQRDLPKFQQFAKDTGGDPIKMAEMPAPIMESPQGQKLLDSALKAASMNALAARHTQLETAKFALATAALQHGQVVPMTTDPVTGNASFDPTQIAEAFNQGSLRDLVGKAFLAQAKPNPLQAKVDLLEDAKSKLATAQKSGNAADVSAAQQRLQSVMETMPGQQVTVFDPKTGQPIVQMGKPGVGGDLTTAATTEEQKQVINSEETIGDLLRTQDQLKSDNVAGIWPTVKNQIFDKLMGNIAPEFVNKQRVAGRASIGWSRQDVINQMRQRYGERAVERISAMLPSTGLLESPEDARILANVATQTLAMESAKRSVAIGRQPGEHVLRAIGSMPNNELDSEISRGYLPPSLAIAALKTKKLPVGQSAPVLGLKPVTGNPLVVSPETATKPTSGRITWDDLFRLYKSGKLPAISGNATESDNE